MQYAASQDVIQRSKREAITDLVKLGFDGMEIVIPDGIHNSGPEGLRLTSDHPEPMKDGVFSEDGRTDVLNQTKEAGLELPSLCPSFLNLKAGLTSDHENDRIRTRRQLEELITAADDVGASTILVPFFEEANMEGCRERVGAELRKVMPTAEAAGVTLALETSLPASDDLELLDNIDSSAAAVYYDVGNAEWFGYDPAKELVELGDSTEMIHIKDGCRGHSDALLGEGTVDFERVSEALSTIDFDGWLVLETAYKNEPLEDAKRNLRYLRRVIE